jgi:hypothetical protein
MAPWPGKFIPFQVTDTWQVETETDNIAEKLGTPGCFTFWMFFKLAQINCTKEFHCGIYIHASHILSSNLHHLYCSL